MLLFAWLAAALAGDLPEVLGTDVRTGEDIKTSSLEGRPILMTFWATW